MFVNLLWPPSLANIPPRYVFLIQIIVGNCIFSYSLAKLANMDQDKQVDKHTPPPSRGGLIFQLSGSVWKVFGKCLLQLQRQAALQEFCKP